MSRRAYAKAVARWEHDTRQWAIDTGRDLALDLYYDRDRGARAYGVGVVLDAGEKVWAEVPVRFNLDWTHPVKAGEQPAPSIRPWLVTSGRVVDRLADDPAPRLPMGECSRSPRRPHGWPGGRQLGHRGPAHPGLVRAGDRPDGRRRHFPPPRPRRHDRPPRPGPPSGGPGLAPRTRSTGGAISGDRRCGRGRFCRIRIGHGRSVGDHPCNRHLPALRPDSVSR